MSDRSDRDLIVETANDVKWIRRKLEGNNRDIESLKRFRWIAVGFIGAVEALLHYKDIFKG